MPDLKTVSDCNSHREPGAAGYFIDDNAGLGHQRLHHVDLSSAANQPIKLTYIISDIDKALAFEWVTDKINKEKFHLSFILILQKPSALEAFFKNKGIACLTFYYRTKKDLPLVLWRVYKALKTDKPAVVHCHLLYGSLIGLTAGRLAGIGKRIYTRHHSDYHQRYFPKGIKWDKWCNRMATTVIAPSDAVKEVLTRYENVSADKIQIIHHGFDLSYFSQVPAERVLYLKKKYQITSQSPVIGVISRFTELKGIQYIIPAFKKLLFLFPDAVLLLFNANGDYKRQIIDLLATIPEHNYRLIAFETDLAAAYQLFNIFIQVSTDRTIEAFGQTYVEALAAGVPSVFTLSGIATDFIVDRENALVVPFKCWEAIYAAILELMNNSALCQRLITHGISSVQEKFNLHLMIQKLEELYAAE